MTSVGSSSSMTESMAEWRSSKQVENSTPSTSPYWDSDGDEYEDEGPKPSELYGRYTWKIKKFAEANKRELRSDVFDIGGYKWYVLIYPHGCDVCNHLSLFLCVANHDKLSPGWRHFAQFTIAVVNKEPKKSKYSDTLHRFWKKEHDWGWRKFIETSKLWDGFVNDDTLIIKAHVQVLRARADRPFRCLDIVYRRELLHIYAGNIAQICRNYVEEKRGKFLNLIEDKAQWSSFVSFWLNLDQDSKDFLSRERADVMLAMAVKQFFVDKEVSSTLVMDSLYSGLKALKDHADEDSRYGEDEDYPFPLIVMEDDTFALMDDVLPLLEMAAMEASPAMYEKGRRRRKKGGKSPQNQTKAVEDGEDLSKDTIENIEKRLTELGRRTIEMFILTHIFGKIEITHQELVALRMQEELIEEEEALLARKEKKGKRGASEKEKKSKKKQDKKRKAKDKRKEDKSKKNDQPITSPAAEEEEELSAPEAENAVENPNICGNISEATEVVRNAEAEVAQPDSSSDSFSEVVRRKSQNGKGRKSAIGGNNHRRNEVSDSADWHTVRTRRASKAVANEGHHFQTSRRFQAVEPLTRTNVSLAQDAVVEKEEKPELSPRERIDVEESRAGNETSGQGSAKLAQEPIENSADDNRAQITIENPQSPPAIAKPEKPSTPPKPITSTPSISAPITIASSSVSMVQSSPILARCVIETADASPSYVPQSYRNAVFGGPSPTSQPASSMANGPSTMVLTHGSDGLDSDPMNVPSFSPEMVTHHMQSGPVWTSEDNNHSFEFSAGPIPDRRAHLVAEDFPHIGIINELFDDDYGFGGLTISGLGSSRQFSFPGEASGRAGPGRLGRTRSYHGANGLRHGYGGSRSGYDRVPQFGPSRQPRNNGPSQSGFPANSWRPTNSMGYSPYGANEGDNGYVFRPSSNGH